MKKFVASIALCFLSNLAFSQREISNNTVNYMLSFDKESELYTAWVVPEYSTPNLNNADTEEKGATAQFSIVVPKGETIQSIKSLKGTWSTKPIKLEIDPKFDYYIIGKTSAETNYGSFKVGQPIALFSFKSKNNIELKVLESNDPFVSFADENYSLNVASSFYSRSGQIPKVNAIPMEQFKSSISIEKMAQVAHDLLDEKTLLSTISSESKEVLAFPNPSTEVLNLKLFSKDENQGAEIAFVNASGNEVKKMSLKTSLGFNEYKLDLSGLTNGTYTLNAVISGKIQSIKIVKIN